MASSPTNSCRLGPSGQEARVDGYAHVWHGDCPREADESRQDLPPPRAIKAPSTKIGLETEEANPVKEQADMNWWRTQRDEGWNFGRLMDEFIFLQSNTAAATEISLKNECFCGFSPVLVLKIRASNYEVAPLETHREEKPFVCTHNFFPYLAPRWKENPDNYLLNK